MRNRKNTKLAITFIEVMIAALLLIIILLPVFTFLTNSVKETERIYVEGIAIARARQIMDTLLFQVPWRIIREGNPCRFDDPANDNDSTKAGYENFINDIVPEIFGNKDELYKGSDGKLIGNGLYESEKGFMIRARAKVVDLDDNFWGTFKPIIINTKESGIYKEFYFKDISPKDADNKYNLVKKIIVQVKWSLMKKKDPNDDPNANSLFLVAFKSNLEG